MSNLDAKNGGQFELYVASTNGQFNGGDPLSVTDLADVIDNGGGSYSYTLPIADVVLTSDPNSYRDAYTVTVKAKNQAETTWSSSSYVLYVYSTDALDILVDGEERDELLMSNEEKIAGLWAEGGSAAIVALQRDIALKNVISINYGEYAWAELADQIQWNSSDSSVASVNYQQGGLYENIERFSYTSYRPATDFVLSGLSDGSTTVTAQHSQADLSTSLEVTVETLRDKLYLFQCYPINTVTTLTYEEYTDESRTQTVTRTVDTNKGARRPSTPPTASPGTCTASPRPRRTAQTSPGWAPSTTIPRRLLRRPGGGGGLQRAVRPDPLRGGGGRHRVPALSERGPLRRRHHLRQRGGGGHVRLPRRRDARLRRHGRDARLRRRRRRQYAQLQRRRRRHTQRHGHEIGGATWD